MSEGYQHAILVSRISEYLIGAFAETIDIILVDVPGTHSYDKPPKIDRFFPDVWARVNAQVIIGEAKTATDLETNHSYEQLECFLKHIALSPPGSQLVVAVPIFAKPRANQIMRTIGSLVNATPDSWHVLGSRVASS